MLPARHDDDDDDDDADCFPKNGKDATGEQKELVIYCKLISNSSRSVNKAKKIAMSWIDNKKANDKVTQSWIIVSLKMYKISVKVIKFMTYEKLEREINSRRKIFSKGKNPEI